MRSEEMLWWEDEKDGKRESLGASGPHSGK